MVRHRPPAVPVPSPVYAQIIDAEVQRLLGEGYNRALDILRANRDVLACLAKLLLEKEVVERTELRELMGTPPGATRDGSGNGARPEVGHAPAGAAD
jgi:ATP-dependent Zn protease